ncbi:hypothetical protein JW721_03130 [Candidatus Micrarchaeota archaeon]|nr:hypothetical protein [Candidatus Micrarchaeota archaeon]
MKMALCLMFVLGILSAFSVGDYLRAGENETSSEEFTAFGSNYELILIDGEEALLLKEGEVLESQSEIEDALREYYTSRYYPSQADIDEIYDLVTLYNESRENGDMYEGVEEKYCRMSFFLDVGLFSCTNDTDIPPTNWDEARGNDCYMLSSVICEEYGDLFGCSDPWDIIDMVRDFAMSSDGLTEIVARSHNNLDNISEDNIYDVFTQLKTDIEKTKEYEGKLEDSIFRVPWTANGDDCNDCLGICTPIIIDEEYLEQAEEKIDELLPRLQYIGEYEELAEKVYLSTIQREDYHEVSLLYDYYDGLFAPEKQRAAELTADADEALELVSDSTVSANAARADELVFLIEERLNASEFASINASRSELVAKLNVLEERISFSYEVYENASEAKEIADSLFFTLETKGLSEEEAAQFTALKSEKRTQDRSFVDGLSADKYAQLTDKYLELSASASDMLNNGEAAGVIVDTFKGAGMKTNNGISDLVTTMVPLERTEREEISGYAPLLISGLSFFSLSSLAVFLMVFVSAVFAGAFRNKLVLLGGVLALGCSILFAGVLSGGIYFVLSSSSTDASFTDFQSQVLGSDHVSIMIDSNQASAGTASAMMRCAQELSSNLEGKEVIIYEKLDGNCLINNSITLSECYNTIEEPIVVLSYSEADEAPQFSTGFVYKGTFYGDEEYFSDCQLATGFMDTEVALSPEETGGEEGETAGNGTSAEGNETE